MASPAMSPDWAYVIGAAVTAGPAYWASRRSRGAAAAEGAATRTAVTDVLNQGLGDVAGRLDLLHDSVKEVKTWQAEHTTEHAITSLTRRRLERRD